MNKQPVTIINIYGNNNRIAIPEGKEPVKESGIFKRLYGWFIKAKAFFMTFALMLIHYIKGLL